MISASLHTRRTAAVLLFTIASMLPAVAGNFTLEQVMSSPFPTGLVAARNAKRVAWVVNFKGVRNIWIADAPGFAARQITQYAGDDGEPIASLRLTPDGRTVVYARGSETNEQGRVADPTHEISARKQQVWALDVDGALVAGLAVEFDQAPDRRQALVK